MNEIGVLHTYHEMHLCEALYHTCGFVPKRRMVLFMCSYVLETRVKCSLLRWHVCVRYGGVLNVCMCKTLDNMTHPNMPYNIYIANILIGGILECVNCTYLYLGIKFVLPYRGVLLFCITTIDT